jgi:hypothetical protein
MSRQEISDPWPSIYWKHSDSTLQLHFEGYKRTISSYGKEEKAFNFERKITLKKLLHIESASLCPSSLNTIFIPQSLSLLLRESHYLSFELAFGRGLKWWRPNWKELGSLVLNRTDTKVCNVDTFVDQLVIEILLSYPIGIMQIYYYYPWACL